MTELNTALVRCAWQDGALCLWGEISQNRFMEAQTLKHWMFAWHRPSYYGTLIETRKYGDKETIVLSADTALDYFSDPSYSQHANLRFSEELEKLMKLAPAVKKILQDGTFMPDYRMWKQGKPGWKLQLPEPEAALAETLPFYEQWSGALAASRTHSADQASLHSTGEHVSLPRRIFPPEPWMDEQDWLMAIGWINDPAPFRTCLQLAEPAGGHGWRLRILLRDRQDPNRLVLWHPAQNQEEYPSSWLPHLQRLNRDFGRWKRIVPWLFDPQSFPDDETDSDATRPIPPRAELTSEEAWRFLAEDSIRLVDSGTTVFLPAWWDRVKQRMPRMRAKIRSSSGSPAKPLFGLEQILQFDWRFAIGDMELTEAEFRELLKRNGHLVNFRGEWIALDPDMIARIRQLMKRYDSNKGLSLRDILKLHLSGGNQPLNMGDDTNGLPEMEVEFSRQLRELMARLTRSSSLTVIDPPASFAGSLRPYQLEGVSWLLFLRQLGLGACLADDMGLGKTVQWITYLLHVKERERPESPSLLICPTSVLGNWQKELNRFAPEIKLHVHYGSGRLKGEAFREAVRDCDVVLTSYSLSHIDRDELTSVSWDSVCLDEAQNIKNAQTKQATAIRGLRGRHRVAMTGTPIENRLSELWSIFEFLNPGYLGSYREFNLRFVYPVEKERDQEKIAAIQRMVRPFLLRRVKNDPAIQLNLPEKNETKTFVHLTEEQGALYEHFIRNLFERLERLSAVERRGMILAALSRLKQLCNHPALFLKEGLHGQSADRSNKVKRLLEMVEELRETGGRCLIFTQFVETGHLLSRLLAHHLRETVHFLHGGTPKAQRDEMIARFQNENLSGKEACCIFILSLKAGGIGLNLTAANHVFHFDRWWNPAVENQATDRAYRIGQKRRVQVHKFVTLGTLEEKIDEMLEEKTRLSEQIVSTGESWITELSTEELRNLFALRNDWL